MDEEQAVEIEYGSRTLRFDVSIHRECHRFKSTNIALPEVVLFKYETDGPWFCFSPVEAGLKAVLLKHCIDHYATSPGYNQFVGKER